LSNLYITPNRAFLLQSGVQTVTYLSLRAKQSLHK
jgi:hypothetical protein